MTVLWRLFLKIPENSLISINFEVAALFCLKKYEKFLVVLVLYEKLPECFVRAGGN